MDPLYMRLCKSQECFRARLNAKPWRISAPILAGHYPFTFSEVHSECEAAREDDTLMAKQYDAAVSTYAACHFVEHLGNTSVVPDVAAVIKLHDQMSGALTNLPLA